MNNKKKILYVRCSTLEQRTDRQRVNESEFDLVVEDKCSGAISFFERTGGIEIKKLVDNNLIDSLSVWQIDRLGRDLRDIMNTIHYFNQKGITCSKRRADVVHASHVVQHYTNRYFFGGFEFFYRQSV